MRRERVGSGISSGSLRNDSGLRSGLLSGLLSDLLSGFGILQSPSGLSNFASRIFPRPADDPHPFEGPGAAAERPPNERPTLRPIADRCGPTRTSPGRASSLGKAPAPSSSNVLQGARVPSCSPRSERIRGRIWSRPIGSLREPLTPRQMRPSRAHPRTSAGLSATSGGLFARTAFFAHVRPHVPHPGDGEVTDLRARRFAAPAARDPRSTPDLAPFPRGSRETSRGRRVRRP